MKTKFRKFPTFSSYSFLSILLGASALLFILWVGIFIWGLVTGAQLPIWNDIWVNLSLALSTPPNHLSNYYIEKTTGNLHVIHPSFIQSFLAGMITPIIWGSVFYVTLLLRKIIWNVDQGKYFESENVKHMKIIGWIVIIVPHIKTFIQNTILYTVPDNILIDGMKIHKTVSGPIQIFGFALVPEVILAGLLIFVFAEVFKAGKVIKEENDLTV